MIQNLFFSRPVTLKTKSQAFPGSADTLRMDERVQRHFRTSALTDRKPCLNQHSNKAKMIEKAA